MGYTFGGPTVNLFTPDVLLSILVDNNEGYTIDDYLRI